MLLDIPDRNKKWLIFGSIFAAVLVVFVVWACVLLTQENFYKGITVEEVNISGLSKQQARALIDDALRNKYKDHAVTLQHKDKNWTVKLSDISYSFLTDKTLEKAYMLGRTGNVFQRLYNIADLMFNEVSFSCETDFDREKLRSILSDIKKQVDRKEKDASIIYQNGNITLTNEIIGASLDVDTSLKMIENQLLKRNFQNIVLKVEEKIPRVVYEDIKDLKHFIASFSTSFNAGDVNRSDNIRLASDRINNTLLMPKDIFSMDKALGARTIENGYKEAPVIYKNELVKGPGGGVCQVTTTLYGTVLRAKAKVLQRSPHSLPLGYVPLGQDATIAEGAIDFKFQNNFDHPLLICSEVKGNKLTIKILGKRSTEDYIVKLKSVILEEYSPGKEEIIIDNNVLDGQMVVVQNAKRGFRVAVYRETYSRNGELLDREKISEDVYRPQKAQIKVNESYFSISPVMTE